MVHPVLETSVCTQEPIGILREIGFGYQQRIPLHDRMVWMKKPTNSGFLLALRLLLLSVLACRPVITIGWQEIGILVLLLMVLLGPPLYRLFKRFDEFQSWKSTKGKDKSED